MIILKKLKITEETFINTCLSSRSMSQTAAKLNINFSTFRRYSKKLKCYNTNQGLKNVKGKKGGRKYKLENILEGKHPQYPSNKLKKRLIKSKIKKNKCEVCELEKWNGKKITLELDHIDGNSRNHKLSNLRILCPNCHSQTETFRNKKRLG